MEESLNRRGRLGGIASASKLIIIVSLRCQAKLAGDFNFFSSYMSQPKTQLETFAAWAGQDSGESELPLSGCGDFIDLDVILNRHLLLP